MSDKKPQDPTNIARVTALERKVSRLVKDTAQLSQRLDRVTLALRQSVPHMQLDNILEEDIRG